MSKSLNKVVLIGHLGRDPELKYTADGTAYARFSLATSESFKNKEGKDVDRTEWHNITVWSKLAETCAQYLKKGARIYMEGKIRTYVDPKDDSKKYYGIQMSEMIFLDNKKSDKPDGVKESSPDNFPPEPKGEDDLPF
jgi:single-strand DNA-binding protein